MKSRWCVSLGGLPKSQGVQSAEPLPGIVRVDRRLVLGAMDLTVRPVGVMGLRQRPYVCGGLLTELDTPMEVSVLRVGSMMMVTRWTLIAIRPTRTKGYEAMSV